MVRRKRPRSSTTVSESARVVDVEEMPNDAEWASYRRYKSFKLPLLAEAFCVGHYVHIRPDNYQPSSSRKLYDASWLGRIQEIRAKDEKCVYILVHWCFTSTAQLRQYGVRGGPKKLLRNEIINSTFADRLSVHAVEDHADVVEYDETDPFQVGIDNDQYFARSSIKLPGTEGGTTGKMIPIVVPNRKPTCLCNKAYKPLPLNSGMMVYCPRVSCERWYHTGCIDHRRGQATVSFLQDLEGCLSPISIFESVDPPLAADSISVDPLQTGVTKDTLDVLGRAAQDSVIRGSDTTGIVGNAYRVLGAREVLSKGRDALQVLAKAWMADFAETEKKGQERTDVWLCPQCDGPI